MKQIIILSLVIFTRLVAQDYFPLEVGNTWTYCYYPDTSNTITYNVSDSIIIDDTKYFLYGMVLPYPYSYIDTIRKDPVGNIWKKVNGIDHLWFDFTKDSGATYTFPDINPPYFYEVKVVDKYFNAQTCNETYSQCIRMFFNNSKTVDEEIYYSFAPQIGPIEIYQPEGAHFLLDSVSINGSPVGIVNNRLSSSNLFELIQNYPNPFNPITTISYTIPQFSEVQLSVFDILGRKVANLVDEEKSAGSYRVKFNGSNLTSGIYLYKLQAGGFAETKKLILLK